PEEAPDRLEIALNFVRVDRDRHGPLLVGPRRLLAQRQSSGRQSGGLQKLASMHDRSPLCLEVTSDKSAVLSSVTLPITVCLLAPAPSRTPAPFLESSFRRSAGT